MMSPHGRETSDDWWVHDWISMITRWYDDRKERQDPPSGVQGSVKRNVKSERCRAVALGKHGEG
jgi:hypothetical protein